MSEKIKGVFIKQMLLPKEELALQTMELMADKMELEKQVEQLESIRKEAIEYINKMWLAKLTPDTVSNTKFDLLNILNKGE
jgi:hypothetical protein